MKKTILAVSLLAIMLSACTTRDDSDPPHGDVSGLTVYTDHLTGNQYLGSRSYGGITPRLDKDGKQVNINNK